MITLKETLSAVTYYDTMGTEVVVTLDDVHNELRDAVLRYGIKQILADAAAAKAGTSTADRMARMQRRADALCDGTWGLRPAKAVPDAEVYAACLLLGKFADDEASRAKWVGLKKADRNAIRMLPDVAAALPMNEKADDVLAMFAA